MEDFAAFADDKSAWSERTFGPGSHLQGILDHIRKELREVEAKPDDVSEWVDLIILAMDGAWRCAGADGNALAAALVAKMEKNKARTWPDWRTAEPGKAIEHDRSSDVPVVKSCNRHADCDAADIKAKAAGRWSADHCHDDCCEECFGC